MFYSEERNKEDDEEWVTISLLWRCKDLRYVEEEQNQGTPAKKYGNLHKYIGKTGTTSS